MLQGSEITRFMGSKPCHIFQCTGVSSLAEIKARAWVMGGCGFAELRVLVASSVSKLPYLS